MFIYLSKKIAIPNNTILKCVSWNKIDGYIVCGGENGMLKALKLEAQPVDKDSKAKGLAAPNNLSMNQTLEGHHGTVQVAVWNEHHQKMTTSDQSGLIIVWMLSRGQWWEEMINNRNKSVVRSMKWNVDGRRICIVYEDGAVIVGSVDGNRIWGKEMKVTLCLVEWSADGRVLLFGLTSGEIQIYDSAGNFTGKLNVYCLADVTVIPDLAAIEWYNGLNGYPEPGCPCLAICYNNGRCQLMRNEIDDDPILLDTGLSKVSQLSWNHDGSVLAASGQSDKNENTVHFYDPWGKHLRTLKVPGNNIAGCSWEGTGLRVALAVDQFIYFANVRPNYKWGYCSKTVIYSYTERARAENVVIFWNIKKEERFIKYVKNLLSISATGDYACLTTRKDDGSGQFALVLCNSLGTPLDTRSIDLEPIFVTITRSVIVAASREAFYIWVFKDPKKLATVEVSGKRKAGAERLFHVDDIPSGAGAESLDFNKAYQGTTDPICAICASDKYLIVARDSGVLNRYSLPAVALDNKYRLDVKPLKIALNSSSSRLSVIDGQGMLTFFDLEASTTDSETGRETLGQKLNFERKDVWDMKWAEDNPELFAMMEKTRMYIFRGTEPEEPIVSSGFICEFNDLQVRAVLLDEILRDAENPTLENLLEMEVKSLRDTRNLIEKVGLIESQQFVEDNPHPRLWRLLAESSLEQLNLKIAETAFVRCKDYHGIRFVKLLAHLQQETMKRAEVAAYFQRFDEAERIYLDMDRRDLAVALRKKLGDWFRVVQLLKSEGSGGDDAQLEVAWNAIGDYYADRHKWREAVTYFEQGRNHERLAECYYTLEDYRGLEKLMKALPENHKLLPDLAAMFAAVGMSEQATEAYVKCNQVRPAIDCCVRLSQWDTAIDLAKKHNVREIDSLLAKYARHLLDAKKVLNAIELYRKAGNFLEGARLLVQIADEEKAKRSPPSRIKKLYVMAGLLVEQYNERQKALLSSSRNATKGSRIDTSAALDGLLNEDGAGNDRRVLETAWRGAEAYHFYMLAQKQLYSGQSEAAVKTALILRDYEDMIPVEESYSLLALCGCAGRAFGTSSRAFIKLETLSGADAENNAFSELAIEVFSKFVGAAHLHEDLGYSAKDSKPQNTQCPNCGVNMPEWSTLCNGCDTRYASCVVTGRPLVGYQYWICTTCKHKAFEREIRPKHACPLCHANAKT